MTTVQTVAWSCWGGFVLLMIAVSAFQVRKLRRREQGMRTWPHVQAVVVGERPVPGVESDIDPSYVSIYEYVGPDGLTRRGETIWSKVRPLPVGQALEVCVNPAKPAESYPVEKTSRVTLGCMFGFMAVVGIGSFLFLRVLLGG